jgi:hypothetical protein
MRNRAGTFSVERLMEFLTALGQDIEITVRPTRKGHGEVSVVAGNGRERKSKASTAGFRGNPTFRKERERWATQDLCAFKGLATRHRFH